jgi:hypothetical protein
VIWRKLDCLNLNLQAMKEASTGNASETGATLCVGIVEGPGQPPECGAMSNEGI